MKIHLDHIRAVLKNPPPSGSLSVRICVDSAEMITEPTPSSAELKYPDVYSFDLDEITFSLGEMTLDVDIVVMDQPDSPVIASGQANLLTAMAAGFHHHNEVSIALGDGVGTVEIRGIINEVQTTLTVLRKMKADLDTANTTYFELREASKLLEEEANFSLTTANKELADEKTRYVELNKKYNELVEEYYKRQEQFNSLEPLQAENQQLLDKCAKLTAENDRLSKELEKTTSRARQSETSTESASSLTSKVSSLEAEVLRLREQVTSNAISFSNNSQLCDPLREGDLKHFSSADIATARALRSENISEVSEELLKALVRIEDLRDANQRLLNRLHSAAAAIQVCARTRPPNSEETKTGCLMIENDPERSSLLSLFNASNNSWNVFELDHHWSYDATQSDVFADVEPLVASVVPSLQELAELRTSPSRVRHAAVLGYGGRDSGKSFTLHGSGAQPGLSLRSVHKVFELLSLQKNALLLRKSSSRKGVAEAVAQLEYDFSVSVSAVEVWEDKVLDMLDLESRRNLAGQVKVVNGEAVVDGLRRQKVESAREALEVVATAWQVATKRDDFSSRRGATGLLLELSVSVKYRADEPAVESRLLLAELPSADATQDANVRGLEQVLDALAADTRPVPFSVSPLTKLLQGSLGEDGSAMLIFTLAPTNLSAEVTRAMLQRSVQMRSVRRTGQGQQSSHDALFQKKIELKFKTLDQDLKLSKLQVKEMEKCLSATKSFAEELVREFNRRNEISLRLCDEERETNKQLKFDLLVVHRSLKKALNDLRDQRVSFDRLSASIPATNDQEKEKDVSDPFLTLSHETN